MPSVGILIPGIIPGITWWLRAESRRKSEGEKGLLPACRCLNISLPDMSLLPGTGNWTAHDLEDQH